MAVVEEPWQSTATTIMEKVEFLFNNDLLSDVKFVVRKTDSESESEQAISAHKFVLSICSPVFEAMFYGELAETRESIELPDCEYESLLEFFRYLYSDEVNLSGSNVMGVLYLAKKYMVPSLADECAYYLRNELDPSNVLDILPHAEKYELQNVVDECWNVIDEQTNEVAKSDGFSTIEKSLLEAVVKRDTLTIEEIELFKAVDLWATKECERRGLAAESLTKRKIIGKNVLKGIRFTRMKEEEFANVVLDSDMLTRGEIVRVIKHFNPEATSAEQFVHSGDLLRCCRYRSLSEIAWSRSGDVEAIYISVDTDIALHGVCFFGGEDQTYSVEFELIDCDRKKILVYKTGNFSSEIVQSEQNSVYWGFKVFFDAKVHLKRKRNYCARAFITGPKTFLGEDCLESVQCYGVTFNFNTVDYSHYPTSDDSGEFPEFLFSIFNN